MCSRSKHLSMWYFLAYVLHSLSAFLYAAPALILFYSPGLELPRGFLLTPLLAMLLEEHFPGKLIIVLVPMVQFSQLQKS